MTHKTTILRAAMIAGLLGSTVAVASAQQTRSASALPSANQSAPTSGVRSATTLRKKSALGGEAVVPAIAAAAIVAGGIYIAVDGSDDEDDGVDSPG
ncbi:hypothetical protein [Sphingomonas japonica]|uniref:Uncharacterized protein n=2 Tax=Sphingomonas japonica TaxID=511662 RepID=A0ABX0U4G4_9SPHN|nr:hypothetical protein [Sphingomonas japonica]NIJ24679.1 hypothetical protein [Sphingomonas japonica]